MAEPQFIPNHAERALSLITSVFKADGLVQPKLRALIRALLEQIQDLEGTFYSLIYDRLLPSAFGAQLDQLGAIVGEPRGNLSDSDYRRFIEARIQINLSNGEPERLVQILSSLTGSDNVQLSQLHPATIIMYFEVPTPLSSSLRERIKDRISEAVAAGIAYQFIEHGPNYFGFEGDDEAGGFSVGRYATVI